jgi:hypothetical protein
MVFDPVTTFVIYIVGILAVFTVIAAIADLWLAHDERVRRDQARAIARAKRTEERGSSQLEWQ